VTGFSGGCRIWRPLNVYKQPEFYPVRTTSLKIRAIIEKVHFLCKTEFCTASCQQRGSSIPATQKRASCACMCIKRKPSEGLRYTTARQPLTTHDAATSRVVYLPALAECMRKIHPCIFLMGGNWPFGRKAEKSNSRNAGTCLLRLHGYKKKAQ
jgi:hypothetical protein